MMKKAFYFTQKLFLFSRCLNFCLDFSVRQQNNLIRKTRLISKFMMSQPGQQAIVIHILPNILRHKSNQTMKFGPLIEYNMRKIFLEKSYKKYGGVTSPRLCLGKLKLRISLDQWPKVLYSLFLLNPKLRAIEMY